MNVIKFRGNRKEVRKKELQLLKKGYIVHVELYDKGIYSLAAKSLKSTARRE